MDKHLKSWRIMENIAKHIKNNMENKDSIRQAQLAFIAKLVLPLLMIIPFVLLESKKNAVISNIKFGTIVIYYVSSKIFKSRDF